MLTTPQKTQLQMDQSPQNKYPYILHLIEEKERNSLELIGTGKDFPSRIPLAQVLRSTINTWGLMKMKLLQSKGQSISLQNGKRISFLQLHIQLRVNIQNM